MVTQPHQVSEVIGHLVQRIEPFTPAEVAPLPDTVTGSLAELLIWWLQRAPRQQSRDVSSMHGNSTYVNSIIDTSADVVTEMETDTGLDIGAVTADKAIDSGATLLTLVAQNNSTSLNTRAIIGLLTHKDAHAVYTQTPGTTDAQAMSDMASIRECMRVNLEDRGNPITLASLDPAVEYTVGLLLCASARRTPVILGNLTHLAAALITQRWVMPSWNWWRYGSTSTDTCVQIAVDRIGIPPGLDLKLSDNSGVGARISAQLLQDQLEQITT